MEDVANVDLDIDALVDVRLPELEIRIPGKGVEVVARPGDEVVEREDPRATRKQGFAQVRADEAGAARNHRAFASRGRYPDR